MKTILACLACLFLCGPAVAQSNRENDVELLSISKLVAEARMAIAEIRSVVGDVPQVVEHTDELMVWAKYGIWMAMGCGGVVFLVWLRRQLA